MKPLVDNTFLLERYEGKGGWTYARIPHVFKGEKKPFNMVRVKGSIDGCEIKKNHLMPMGDGRLFLAVKSEIRKKIGKQAGDKVHIILYPDNDPLEIPAEFELCMMDEPRAQKFFNSISESEQRFYINWIYSAKRMETRVNRLAKAIDRLARGLKLYDKEDMS